MNVWALTAVAALIFVWSLVSDRIERLDVTGPIVFVVAGVLLCNGPVAAFDLSIGTSGIHELAEVTLVLLLFSDAARVDPRDLRRHAGLPVRLLAVGLPLTFAAGFGLAAAIFTELPWQMAALVGAALAPTDAALSAAVVSDPSLPVGIRRSLNVESGLNDGIATPAVTALIAATATVIGVGEFSDSASGPGWAAAVDLAGGALIGTAVGFVGGVAITRARALGWIAPGGRRLATLMLATLPFVVSRGLGVNYFVAAFVAGLAFRAALGSDVEEAVELPELLGEVLSLTVWFVFGGVLLLDGVEMADWRALVYGLLSLTVVRMVPVALSLVGARTGGPATLFIGWFGPRGLASVVFGLLIIEELPVDDPRAATITSIIAVTVLMSVVLHGATGRPLTAWMASRAASGAGDPEAGGDRIRPRGGI